MLSCFEDIEVFVEGSFFSRTLYIRFNMTAIERHRQRASLWRRFTRDILQSVSSRPIC